MGLIKSVRRLRAKNKRARYLFNFELETPEERAMFKRGMDEAGDDLGRDGQYKPPLREGRMRDSYDAGYNAGVSQMMNTW